MCDSLVNYYSITDDLLSGFVVYSVVAGDVAQLMDHFLKYCSN
jgi:hypothetical protein